MTDNIEQIVRQHSDLVYRLALLHTKHREDAEDVFQNVFVKLIRYQERIQSEEHLKYWLIRVTLNECKSMHTQAARKHEVTVEEMPEQSVVDELPQESIVYQTVAALPEKYRTVLHLFYYEELSIKEISVIQKKREGTIKSLLSRGRHMLEQLLAEAGYHDREEL